MMHKNLGSFNIAGILVRTTNLAGQSQVDIGNLWARFFADNITSMIPAKLSDDLICAYTEYESDMYGWYSVILGYKVAQSDNVTNEISVVNVPPSKYQVFISADAKPETVVQTWMLIWQSEIPRAYQTDFDLYLPDGRVETYLSIK
jgi:predicted transcriptional regulator YdeE